jgi:hypothetical protein
LTAQVRERDTSRFVGRGPEQRLLERSLEEVRRGASPAVAVVGEPGIGKSRLLQEVRRRAEASGCAVLAGRGSELELDVPFGIVTEAMDDVVARIGPEARDAGELEEIPGVTVRDIGAEQCGIVTFTADGIEAEQVQQALAEHSMNVTISTVESTRFDMEARGLNEIVRASVHYYNDEAEIERFFHSRLVAPDALAYAILERPGESFVGFTTFSSLDPDNGSVLYHITLGEREVWGRGLGTEATALIVVSSPSIQTVTASIPRSPSA